MPNARILAMSGIIPILLSITIIPADSQNENQISVVKVIFNGKEYEVGITNANVTQTLVEQSYIDFVLSPEAQDRVIQITMPRILANELFRYEENEPYSDFVAVFSGDVQIDYRVLHADCETLIIEILIYAGHSGFLLAGPLIPTTWTPPKAYAFIQPIVTEGEEFRLKVVTNAQECTNFSLSKDEKKLQVDLNGPMEREGYFQISLPHRFLGGNYTVLMDNVPTEFNASYIPSAEGDQTILSLSYEGKNARSLEIIGASVIPEFSIVLQLVFVMSIVIFLVYSVIVKSSAGTRRHTL